MDQAKVRQLLHDINNRVAVVLTSAEVLQIPQIVQLPPKALERVKAIEHQAMEISALVRELRSEIMG